MARRKTKKRAASSGFKRCKFVGRRGSKRVADRLVRELRKDGFDGRRLPAAGLKAGYDVVSCGALKKKPRRRRRR